MKGYCDKHKCEYDYEITECGKETDTCPQCRDEHFEFMRKNTKPRNPFADLAKQWADRLAQKGEGQ